MTICPHWEIIFSNEFPPGSLHTLSGFLAPSVPTLLKNKGVGVCSGWRHQSPLHRESEPGRILFTKRQ